MSRRLIILATLVFTLSAGGWAQTLGAPWFSAADSAGPDKKRKSPVLGPSSSGVMTPSSAGFATPSSAGFTTPSSAGGVTPSSAGFTTPSSAGVLTPSVTGTTPSAAGVTPSAARITPSSGGAATFLASTLPESRTVARGSTVDLSFPSSEELREGSRTGNWWVDYHLHYGRYDQADPQRAISGLNWSHDLLVEDLRVVEAQTETRVVGVTVRNNGSSLSAPYRLEVTAGDTPLLTIAGRPLHPDATVEFLVEWPPGSEEREVGVELKFATPRQAVESCRDCTQGRLECDWPRSCEGDGLTHGPHSCHPLVDDVNNNVKTLALP